jgi:serine/threonine protein kinase
MTGGDQAGTERVMPEPAGSANERTERGIVEPTQVFHESETVLQDQEPRSKNAPRSDQSVADLDEFKRVLIELGLSTGSELAAFEVDPARGVLGLAQALVRAGRLTPYQSAAIYQRKSRGLLIGKYLILDKLGQGGMGVVFKAKQHTTGRIVALKILPPSFARDRQALARFKREVAAAGLLNHPNVVAALDADDDRGVHFLVMEYVEGRDVDRVVQANGPLPVVQVIDYVIQAARGLGAAHAQGIVHRDIKPGNLMLDADGNVRVLDLGLARIVEESNPFAQTASARLTQSGMYMGTIDYMAPEQAEDSRRADHRADIYSLGCTLYYLLTGKEPFPAETVLKRLMAHQERPAPKLRASRPDAPEVLELAFQRMMAKRPAERPATITELIALLETCKLASAEVRTASEQAPKSRSELKVFDEPLKHAWPARTQVDPAAIPLREASPLPSFDELRLEDLAMDVRSESPALPLPIVPEAPGLGKERLRTSTGSRTHRRQQTSAAGAVVGSLVLAGLIIGRLVLFSRTGGRPVESPPKANVPEPPAGETKPVPVTNSDNSTISAPETPTRRAEGTPIFDGKSTKGWMLCDGRPMPQKHIQGDSINPHGSKSYLVVYDQPLADFVLDFDHKLTKRCNSGVFLRVSNLKDPVNTGVEVALDDTYGTGFHDPGAFYDLVRPTVQAQKAAGEWNHMTITARGPLISVSLNGVAVSSINLDEWSVPGKRPDGSNHKFKNTAIARMARFGYLGVQDHGGDCWFKNILLKEAMPVSPGVLVAAAEPSKPVASALPPSASTSLQAPSFSIPAAASLSCNNSSSTLLASPSVARCAILCSIRPG